MGETLVTLERNQFGSQRNDLAILGTFKLDFPLVTEGFDPWHSSRPQPKLFKFMRTAEGPSRDGSREPCLLCVLIHRQFSYPFDLLEVLTR